MPNSIAYEVYTNIVAITVFNKLSQGSTQPLTEMSTRNVPGGKGRLARRADNLTAIYEQIV
jgi:hypothetical protein